MRGKEREGGVGEDETEIERRGKDARIMIGGEEDVIGMGRGERGEG